MTNLNQKLAEILHYTQGIQPELLIVAVILLVTLFDLILVRNKNILPYLVLLGLCSVLVLELNQLSSIELASEKLFSGMIMSNRPSTFWRIIFDIATILIIILGIGREPKEKKGEYYVMILGILLGAHLLAMSSNLLMAYLSIELISILSYILTAFAFTKQSNEAALKYLLFGAVASGVMLYGMSLIYAITGSLDITTASFIESLMTADELPVLLACIMVSAGFLFKISAIPFHIWTPDVYTAAHTPVVGYFSVVPKLAGLSILFKWVIVANLFGQGPVNWQVLLAIISMITILVGNFSAIWQNNVKRLLAYSAIAHSGFLLIGLVSFSESGLQSLYFYAFIYLLMNIGAFTIVQYFEKKEDISEIEDYRGLMSKYPLAVISFLVFMVSLAGLPPTAGFTAKLFIFSSLWEAYQASNNDWLFYLLIFGLVNTVVSLLYYLKIPYYMIFKTQVRDVTGAKKINSIENYLGVLLVLGLLILFFKPEWLMNIFNNVTFTF
ncbi:MAG: NADH-quinone oxidoreductase subunit N [Bacteroidota bacterium]